MAEQGSRERTGSCFGPSYTGHNYIGHNYVDHNCIGHTHMAEQGSRERTGSCLGWQCSKQALMADNNKKTIARKREIQPLALSRQKKHALPIPLQVE